MNKKKAQAVYILFGLLIVGSLVYLYFLVQEAGDRWPSENEPGSLTNQITRLRTSISQLRAQEAQIPERREALAAISIDFELASRVLPRESSPDQLIAAIRTKAQQSGVVPTSLQPSIVQTAQRARKGGGGGGQFETWRFTLDVSGSYDQIAAFINRMEEFDSPDAARTGSEKRFFEVRDITIEAQDSGLANLGGEVANSPLRHKCTLVMQTYRYTGE